MDDNETRKPIGPTLDELGVEIELDIDERVTEVLVIAKTMDLETGAVSLLITSNDLDWIQQWGLHAAAGQVYQSQSPLRCGDEDD